MAIDGKSRNFFYMQNVLIKKYPVRTKVVSTMILSLLILFSVQLLRFEVFNGVSDFSHSKMDKILNLLDFRLIKRDPINIVVIDDEAYQSLVSANANRKIPYFPGDFIANIIEKALVKNVKILVLDIDVSVQRDLKDQNQLREAVENWSIKGNGNFLLLVSSQNCYSLDEKSIQCSTFNTEIDEVVDNSNNVFFVIADALPDASSVYRYFRSKTTENAGKKMVNAALLASAISKQQRLGQPILSKVNLVECIIGSHNPKSCENFNTNVPEFLEFGNRGKFPTFQGKLNSGTQHSSANVTYIPVLNFLDDRDNQLQLSNDIVFVGSVFSGTADINRTPHGYSYGVASLAAAYDEWTRVGTNSKSSLMMNLFLLSLWVLLTVYPFYFTVWVLQKWRLINQGFISGVGVFLVSKAIPQIVLLFGTSVFIIFIVYREINVDWNTFSICLLLPSVIIALEELFSKVSSK